MLGEWSYTSKVSTTEGPRLNTGLHVILLIEHVDGVTLRGRVGLWFSGDVGLPPSDFGPVTGSIEGEHAVSLSISRTAPGAAPITITGAVDGRLLTIHTSWLGENIPGPFPTGGSFERAQ
jgi:hypothetical protein